MEPMLDRLNELRRERDRLAERARYYERMAKELDIKVQAFELVLAELGQTDPHAPLPMVGAPDDSEGSANATFTVRSIVAEMTGQFGVEDVIASASRKSDQVLGREQARKVLARLAREGEIAVLAIGRGKRATVYAPKRSDRKAGGVIAPVYAVNVPLAEA